MYKKLACGLVLLFSASLMLRPVVRSVNISAGKASFIAATANAEGDPMPDPRGPHKPGAGLLAAEGDPMPHPGGPHTAAAGSFAAEGDPMPHPGGPHVITTV